MKHGNDIMMFLCGQTHEHRMDGKILHYENLPMQYTEIFSSPEPSGSQGELIVYPCSVVRPSVRPSVRRPSSVRPSSTIFKDLLF